jgi:hypothetical protein
MLVNADELIMALESGDSEVDWYLDLSTGAVVPVVGDLLDVDPSMAEALEAQPDRFFAIDPISSHEAFSIMEAFVAGLPQGAPTARLAAALSQGRPFRHFKDALLEWPHIREQWFRFHNARMRMVAEEWITANDLSVQLSPRTESEPEA